MTIIPYTYTRKDEWNRFVAESKNGTFLFNRDFMDYHSDRFEDCSLLVEHKDTIIACMAANIDRQNKQIISHGGLTYGGLILSKKTCTTEVLEAFKLILAYYHNKLGAASLVYKPIPYIYNKYPAEEDLYALFRNGAELLSRGVSSCIDLTNGICFSDSRKDGIRKAKNAGLTVVESNNINDFWQILNDTLQTCHGTTPVHTTGELQLLKRRFPKQIRLYTTLNKDKRIIAGALVFEMGQTVHTQYLAANEEGKRQGALDILLHHLITDTYANLKYFDFGISTENGGKYLNEGLIFQKEGFGGRAVCYDTYIVKNLSSFG